LQLLSNSPPAQLEEAACFISQTPPQWELHLCSPEIRNAHDRRVIGSPALFVRGVHENFIDWRTFDADRLNSAHWTKNHKQDGYRSGKLRLWCNK